MRCLLAIVIATGCWAQWLSPTHLDQNQPAPADSLYREVLGALCPGQYVFNANSRGCRVCPADTMDAGQKQEVRLISALPGHFKSPASDDVLVVIYGCEPHSNHYIDAFLLTREGTHWEKNKAGDMEARGCRKIANPEGRDGLLCYAADMYSGMGSGSLSFSYVGGKSTPILSTVLMAMPCAYPNGPAMVANPDITGVRLVARPSGGPLLTVRAVCARGRKVCHEMDDIAKRPSREYMLDFQFDGTAFKVTPASASTLREYEACSTPDVK